MRFILSMKSYIIISLITLMLFAGFKLGILPNIILLIIIPLMIYLAFGGVCITIVNIRKLLK